VWLQVTQPVNRRRDSNLSVSRSINLITYCPWAASKAPYLLIYRFIHSGIHSFTHSFIHSFFLIAAGAGQEKAGMQRLCRDLPNFKGFQKGAKCWVGGHCQLGGVHRRQKVKVHGRD
jgi:hypothetical protein